jgi:hypothetical protein
MTSRDARVMRHLAADHDQDAPGTVLIDLVLFLHDRFLTL